MRFGFRAASVAAVLAGLLSAGTASARGESTGTTAPAHVLYAGQTLVAKTDHDTLSIGQFEFMVDPEDITLWQWATMQGPRGPSVMGTGVWFESDHRGGLIKGNSVLRMQRDGNLVYRTQLHRLLWQSGTRGRHNRLVLRRNGALVIEDGHGRTVWSAHTHADVLGDGSTLEAGQTLDSRYGDWQGGPLEKLTMQRGGDLVLRCGGHPVWSSHTHRRGSALSLLRDGNLVIRGPFGRTLWRSHSRGTGPYTYLLGSGLVIKNMRGQIVWAAHQRRSACDPYA
jgi:hypothetical protein